MLPFIDVLDFGKIIIQLVDKENDPICYYKSHVKNFLSTKKAKSKKEKDG